MASPGFRTLVGCIFMSHLEIPLIMSSWLSMGHVCLCWFVEIRRPWMLSHSSVIMFFFVGFVCVAGPFCGWGCVCLLIFLGGFGCVCMLFPGIVLVALISMGFCIFCSPSVDSVGLVFICFSVWSVFRQGMFVVSFPALSTRFLECLFLFSELLSPWCPPASLAILLRWFPSLFVLG